MGTLTSSLTWRKHGHRASTPTSNLASEPVEATHARVNICRRAQTSSRACTRSPQHLFFIITVQSAGGKVGPVLRRSCTQCARWAVIDTRPQTRVVTEEWRRDPVGSEKSSAHWNSEPCPSQAQTHTWRYTLNQTHTHTRKTGHRTCFVLSDVATTLPLRDNNSQEDASTLQVEAA